MDVLLGLYLNFDPSHLVWMGIDPVTVLTPYVDRIAHAQAKDIQIFPEKRIATAGLGPRSTAMTRGTSLWRYRVPGLGQVDSCGVVDALYEHGFDGVLSVEHEDLIWGGTESKIKTGLQIAHHTLRPLMVG